MHRAYSLVWLWAIALGPLATSGTGVVSSRPPQTQPPLDRRPAIVAGPWTVSNYLVRKFFGRYAAEIQQEYRREPTPAEKRKWFEGFVAKQVLIAHAAVMGYLDRPEVHQAVARMERHMLTQSSGPLYTALFPPRSQSDEELLTFYLRTKTVREILVARFQSDQLASAVLGSDFSNTAPEEQRRRILGARTCYGIEVLAGRRPWPFLPFAEIADVIEHAGENRWFLHRDKRLGTYAIFVRRVAASPENTASRIPTNLQAYADQVTHDQQVRLRRIHLLKDSDFVFDADVAKDAIVCWSDAAASAAELPALPEHALDERILFSFVAETDRVPVPLEVFRRHFNAQFIRTRPRSIANLRALAEDFAVEEMDFRIAKARGIDTTPQFAEDRHGFAGYQALELFEKECVSPRLPPTEGAIERYYRAHAVKYRRTTRVRVRRLSFASVDAALEWQRASAAESSSTERPLSDDVLEIDRSNVPSEFDAVGHEILLDAHPGRPIGPLPHDGQMVVYVVESRLASEPLPVDAVAASIRHLLRAEALSQEERNLSKQFMRELPFENRIDYTSYGILEPAAGER